MQKNKKTRFSQKKDYVMISYKKKRKVKMIFENRQSEEIEFFNWIRTNWIKAGGLINQATATRLLNKSKGRVNQMITEGKLKEYRYKKFSFLSFTEVMNIAQQIAIKRAIKQGEEIINSLNLTDEQKKQEIEALKKTIEEGESIKINQIPQDI